MNNGGVLEAEIAGSLRVELNDVDPALCFFYRDQVSLQTSN